MSGMGNNPTQRAASSIQTVLSAPESDRICLSARGVYRREGISPCPEDYLPRIE